ncbi:MAG: alpha/beta hydrolase family esterase [Thermoanaerobaculia bacterium]
MTRTRVLTFLLLVAPAVATFSAWAIDQWRFGTNGSIVADGLRRTYLLHVPRGLDPARPVPLVISLHGGALRPGWQRRIDGWTHLADRHGFLVVYPAGRSGGPRHWEMDDRDLRFIAGLIDHLASQYPVDRSRIYLSGFSNGGNFAYVLSCALDDRVAAIGMVGAAFLFNSPGCRTSDPVPMISFHGTEDRAALYRGGSSFATRGVVLPAVPAFTERNARRIGCRERDDARLSANVTRTAFTGCEENAEVVLYSIEGAGHIWPGGHRMKETRLTGKPSDEIDATATMWEFFSRHPRPRPAP